MTRSLSLLHLRLTLLFLGTALLLLLLLGFGLYYGLLAYFTTVTDEALEHKMVHEFQLLDAPLPPALASADRDWSTRRAGLFTRAADESQQEREDEHSKTRIESEHEVKVRRAAEVAYNGELAAVFVLPLDAQGQLLVNLPPPAPPIAPDRDAAAAALYAGYDWRTVQTPDGSRVRLLTYRLTRTGEPALLQLGRTLSDQERVLGRLLTWFIALGGVSVVLMAILSWSMAGRSLRPAQEAWERQQVFVANASHELRTPLTLMRASVEVAQRGLLPGDSERRELLDDTLHECDHMGRLVEDLLLLSRLDAGRLPLHTEALAARELLAEIERQVQPLAQAAGIRLSVEQADDVAALGDAARVRQVLLILIDNALRYTPRSGTIALTARRTGREVEFAVIDSGIGIAPEHQSHIFERFWRADSTSPHSQGGAGLGLAIARQLIDAQRGRLGLSSSLGQGSRFFFRLPLA